MDALLQTIIGALAAILGGLLAVWYQHRHTAAVAAEIRAQEREEEALLALDAALPALKGFMDTAILTLKPPVAPVPWEALESRFKEIFGQWDEVWSMRIRSPSVASTVADLSAQLRDAGLFVRHDGLVDEIPEQSAEPFVARVKTLRRTLDELHDLIYKGVRGGGK